jgi:hypothetical protein
MEGIFLTALPDFIKLTTMAKFIPQTIVRSWGGGGGWEQR